MMIGSTSRRRSSQRSSGAAASISWPTWTYKASRGRSRATGLPSRTPTCATALWHARRPGRHSDALRALRPNFRRARKPGVKARRGSSRMGGRASRRSSRQSSTAQDARAGRRHARRRQHRDAFPARTANHAHSRSRRGRCRAASADQAGEQARDVDGDGAGHVHGLRVNGAVSLRARWRGGETGLGRRRLGPARLHDGAFCGYILPGKMTERLLMSDMRLVMAGAGGRMGRTLIKAIAQTATGMTLVGALEAGRLAADRAGCRRARRAAGESGVKVTSDAAAALTAARRRHRFHGSGGDRRARRARREGALRPRHRHHRASARRRGARSRDAAQARP